MSQIPSDQNLWNSSENTALVVIEITMLNLENMIFALLMLGHPCIVEFCIALCMHGWLRRGCSDAFRKEGGCYSEKHARSVSSRPGDRSSAQ